MSMKNTLILLSALVLIGAGMGQSRQDDKGRVGKKTGDSGEPKQKPLPDPLEFAEADFSSDERAHFHPHGAQVCKSGCALSNHPTDELSVVRFRRLLAQYSREAIKTPSQSLEVLLFYGRQTRQLLTEHGSPQLSAAHASFLSKEVRRSHVKVSLRLLDDHGEVIAKLPSTRVPLDRRHEFVLESSKLPAVKASGTIKRVGLKHLWTRL